MIKLDYDKYADVLRITSDKSAHKVTYYENNQGHIVRVNENKQVVSITVPRFSRQSAQGEIVINEI